ncbi:MerR family DNA-binding protein [Streptomyces sioyaensis]|uniref:MerR family DNA-binding protein n=1 Tax=Streptomyces sioyaensis TaxID=67364 RepID=UPI003D70A58E
MSLQEVRQILTVHDRGESPCGHVGRVLTDRLNDVRAQIAELATLETHLKTLLTHAEQGPADGPRPRQRLLDPRNRTRPDISHRAANHHRARPLTNRLPSHRSIGDGALPLETVPPTEPWTSPRLTPCSPAPRPHWARMACGEEGP